MKKVMLLAAMLAMVLAAAVPALAQGINVQQIGQGNVACVQTAVNQEIDKEQIAVSAYGDATNYNIQQISQECNIAVSEVNTVIEHVAATATATASASATASATAAPVEHEYATPSATASAAAVQYQYASPTAEAELPPTGGSSLIALGAGVLLVAGGLLARRIVR